MEIQVRKQDMTLDVMDDDHSIRDYVLSQLDEAYPADIYNRTSSWESFIYSIKGDLPFAPIADLRNRVYNILDLQADDYMEQSKEKELLKELDGVSVSEAVRMSQYSFFCFNCHYNWFRWVHCPSKIPARIAPGRSPSSLYIEERGIQIYRSKDYFDAEARCQLEMLASPLRAALGDNLPYVDTIRVGIQDVQ